MPRYERYDRDGYSFVFKYDEKIPDLLHIWVRHLKTPEQAVQAWFEGESEVWNAQNRRFETYTEKLGVYWVWLEQDRTVLIISCFDL